MKVSLKLVDKGMEVEIHAENDLEIIALEAWSDKYFNGKEGAFLIVSRDMIAPNNACSGQLVEWVECPHCNGKKMEVPDCEECEGRGWIDDPDGGTMTCPECDSESCSVCGGEGYVAAEHSAHADAGKPADLQADSNADNKSTSQAVA